MEDRIFNHRQLNSDQIESYVEGILNKYALLSKERRIVWSNREIHNFLLKFKINILLTGEVSLSSYLIPSFTPEISLNMVSFPDQKYHLEDINLKDIVRSVLVEKIEGIMLRIIKTIFLGKENNNSRGDVRLDTRYVMLGSGGKISEKTAPIIARSSYLDFHRHSVGLKAYHINLINLEANNLADFVFNDKVTIKGNKNKLVLSF